MGLFSHLSCFSISKSGKNRLPTTTTFNILEELCHHFLLTEIQSALTNVNESLVVGKDSFGVVYKGYLNKGDHTTVAIKWFRNGSLSGISESQLKNEVLFLCQLHHPNIMPLIGFCIERDPHLILVHEYMFNGSLSDHLHNHKDDPLPWKRRLQICIGVARGLHYLHTGGKYSVIHNFLKTRYILLDQNWEPKISGLLLSKRGHIDVASSSSLVARNHDTFAYCDPEYAASSLLTVKSNVFSFGVVLLEMVSAKQAQDLFSERNQLMNKTNCSLELQAEKIVDPCLKSQIAPVCWKTFSDITERCLHKHGTERPNMGEVEVQLELALQLQEEAET